MKLAIVLGDQLNFTSPLFKKINKKTDLIWMAEVSEESTVVWSHKNRTTVFLSAMRHFAQDLKKKGFRLHYVKLDDPKNTNSFSSELTKAIKKYKPESLLCVEPGEWRVEESLRASARIQKKQIEFLEDDHFICSRAEFSEYAKEHPHLRMEFFYRTLRRKTGVLMQKDKPVGGVWNFDKENRGSFGKDGPSLLPSPYIPKPDKITQEVIALVEKKFPDHPGDTSAFVWPVTRPQALKALDDFIQNRLPHFGTYQDAMWTGEPFLYHSLLSSSLNLKLLDTREVILKAEEAYKKKKADLASTEGFIRQILGWREYVRGVYWTFMPEYLGRNHLGAKEKLPKFYWNAKTDMNCLNQALSQTLKYGYAHHIQRLMVTGLFSLLYGVNPKEIHEWYLAVYVDAIEWVELPNTLGMSQFGDGDVMASKPYVATGKYIQRMSNYCKGCKYNPANSVEGDACPFTTLYWDFLFKHKTRLQKNQRMQMQLRNLVRIKPEKEKKIKLKAKEIRNKIQKGERI